MTRRWLHEDAIQRAVFEHLAVRGVPRLFAFHPANGGYRLPVEAARLKGLGVRAGGHAQVCYGLDHALAVLEGWGSLRGHAVGHQ